MSVFRSVSIPLAAAGALLAGSPGQAQPAGGGPSSGSPEPLVMELARRSVQECVQGPARLAPEQAAEALARDILLPVIDGIAGQRNETAATENARIDKANKRIAARNEMAARTRNLAPQPYLPPVKGGWTRGGVAESLPNLRLCTDVSFPPESTAGGATTRIIAAIEKVPDGNLVVSLAPSAGKPFQVFDETRNRFRAPDADPRIEAAVKLVIAAGDISLRPGQLLPYSLKYKSITISGDRADVPDLCGAPFTSRSDMFCEQVLATQDSGDKLVLAKTIATAPGPVRQMLPGFVSPYRPAGGGQDLPAPPRVQ